MSIIAQDDWWKRYDQRQTMLVTYLMEFIAVCNLVFDAQRYPELLPFALLTYVMARLFGWHIRNMAK